METKIINGGVTPEKIAQWKHVHRKVVEITIKDGDTEYKGYLRTPDMKTISAVNSLNKSDEFKAGEVMIKNCWLGGAEELLNDGLLFLGAMEQFSKVLGQTSGSIKNL